MNYNKIVVLVNSAAKSKKLDKSALENACNHINKFKQCQIIYTENIDDFVNKTKQYSSEPNTLIAVAGGDGTINLALNKLENNSNLGIIPTGTANVIAKELGFPSRILDCLKLLLTGAVQNIDLGTCCNKKFAFVAGIGFDAVVASKVSKKLKSIFGQVAYGIETIRTALIHKPSKLTIECEDGQILTGYFAIFANMRRYGGELYFAPEASYNDGLLNLVLLKEFSFSNLFKLIKYAYGKGTIPEMVIKKVGRHFKVIASEPTLYELDGEVFGPEKEFNINIEPLSQGIITT
jgi:YegS/Rv2252/BmrU family lipid kinase